MMLPLFILMNRATILTSVFYISNDLSHKNKHGKPLTGLGFNFRRYEFESDFFIDLIDSGKSLI